MRMPTRSSGPAQHGVALIMFGLAVGGILLDRLTPSRRQPAFVEAAAAATETTAGQDENGGGGGGLSSYFGSARRLVNAGLDAQRAANSYSGLMSMSDANPQSGQALRDTIDKTTSLIGAYQQGGLANMPALPSVMGLNSLVHLPDKLLRAELSMLQQGIRMAEEMRARPLQATMNTPQGLATMFSKMMEQLSQ